MVRRFFYQRIFFKKKLGFTLIELLVVISIIGILISLSLFGIQNARKSSRDAKRKSDLESIRSALEMYKADNGKYPSTSSVEASSLSSYISSYIASIPSDPLYPSRFYTYTCSPSGNCTTYALCASLESSGTTVGGCGGNCGMGCNYKVTNP